MKMLDFVYFIDNFKILKNFFKPSKFSTIFHRETSQAPPPPPPPPPPQRPYDVSRGQNRYVTLSLISCAFKALYSYHSFYTRWRSVELGQNTDIGTDGRIAIGGTQFLVKLILKYVMESMHVSDLDRLSSVRPYPRFNPQNVDFFQSRQNTLRPNMQSKRNK